MDTRTGQIYEAESAAALAKKLGTDESDIVMLDKLPDGTCRHCHSKCRWKEWDSLHPRLDRKSIPGRHGQQQDASPELAAPANRDQNRVPSRNPRRRNPQFAVRTYVSRSRFEQLRSAAESRGASVSELVRDALDTILPPSDSTSCAPQESSAT